MKWFKHDSDASIDAKMQEVLLDYGLEGYGLYWYCLELIASSIDKHNLNFELEHDARIIARNTGSTIQKVQEMMTRFTDLGLFENVHGRIFCLKMASRTDEYTAQLMRENKKSIHTIPIVSLETTDIVPRKSEVIEEKRREEITTYAQDEFETFYKAYPKKKNKGDAEKAWKSIKPDLNKILVALEWQKQSDSWKKSNGQFIPYPGTYLRAKGWEDEQSDIYDVDSYNAIMERALNG